MNSLEDQARAAVRATASEIGPQDVPPMRPLGSGDGGRGTGTRHGRGGPRRRGALQWGVPLAAAAAVVAVVVGAGLIGGISPASRPAAHPAAAKPSKTANHLVPAPAPAYPANLKAGLTGFYLPASGAQYTTGALFTGEVRWLEGAITERCMASRGFPVQAIATPAQIARAFWDLSQFPDLRAIAKAGALPSYSIGPTPSEPKAYQQAYDQCSSAALVPFKPMESAGRNLGDPFVTTVISIESSAAVNATLPALRSCAARYGWPSDPYGPNRPINSFSDFIDWIAGHIDGADSRGASAATMNELNRQWAKVLVQCGGPTVAIMERLQLAAQRRFIAGHRGEFDALVKVARQDFARAERLAHG